MKELLNTISEIMKLLEINYDYLELKSKLKYPYVIGEYFENEYIEESHCSKGEFLLTIWDKNLSSMKIIEFNQKIKKKFADLKIIKNNIAINLSYSNSLPVLQDIDNIKKQEIRIDVQYFEGGD